MAYWTANWTLVGQYRFITRKELAAIRLLTRAIHDNSGLLIIQERLRTLCIIQDEKHTFLDLCHDYELLDNEK